MIGYVTLGSNDLEKAFSFYDEVFAVLGATRLLEFGGNGVIWGTTHPTFGVLQPHDGKAASVGNGSMTAIAAGSNENVDAMYAKAIELGGTDEGEPGFRHDTFYAAYFRDLDGNKLAAFHTEMP